MFTGDVFTDTTVLAPQGGGARIACMEPLGVNLLLQRWVHHNSRVVVPTHTYNEVAAGPYEEADLTEVWCEARMVDGLSVDEATTECLEWLREVHTPDGPTRQRLMVDPQHRASIRAVARQHLRSLSSVSPHIIE